MTNIKQLINWGLKGAAIIGGIFLSAYAEGMGRRSDSISVTSSFKLPFTSCPDDLAISEILKGSRDLWKDSDKVEAAKKITGIAKKEGQSSYTKTVAINALSQIRDDVWQSTSKTAITDYIISIV